MELILHQYQRLHLMFHVIYWQWILKKINNIQKYSSQMFVIVSAQQREVKIWLWQKKCFLLKKWIHVDSWHKDMRQTWGVQTVPTLWRKRSWEDGGIICPEGNGCVCFRLFSCVDSRRLSVSTDLHVCLELTDSGSAGGAQAGSGPLSVISTICMSRPACGAQ